MILPRLTSHPEPNAPSGSELAELEGQAHGLADRLPDILIEAMRISSTLTHGIHGRRRAGPGETFWQFRQLEASDAAQLIDWRRSASSDHLYVREREWEAAHTFWLWADLSASMQFQSHLSATTKRDRALVLMLTATELLVRSGERVGLIGLTRPMASRKATSKLAETLAANAGAPQIAESLPPGERLARFSGVLLISDFLDPLERISERLGMLAGNGVAGHLIQVLDPAEETLPYEGRAEFLGMEGSERWIADRTESLREPYMRRLAAHRAGLADIARRLGWSFLVHRTDGPAAEPLLALIMRLQTRGGVAAPAPAGPRPPSAAASPGEA